MQYDKNRFKIWALPHPILLHWALNPGIMFGELILGVRVAKVTLIDKKSDKPLVERTYIPCPHCETLNDARLWAKWDAFGHWFGFVCPNCYEIIPCLWNIFSLVILAITFPLWYLPVRFFRQRWLEKEKKRVKNALKRPFIQVKFVHWVLMDTFGWGGFMWIFMEVGPQAWEVWRGEEWDLTMMFVALGIWLVTGFAMGWFTGFWMNSKSNRERRTGRLSRLWMHYWMNSKGR